MVLEDANYIEKHVSLITGVAAQVYRSAQLKFGNKNTNTTVRGTGKSYVHLANFEMEKGRYFNQQEINAANIHSISDSAKMGGQVGWVNENQISKFLEKEIALANMYLR